MKNKQYSLKDFDNDIESIVEPIKIWKFELAPEKYRKLSTFFGDEDWLALVPPLYKNDYLSFLECEAFGCCDVDIINLKNNYKIYIGCHA